MPLMGPPKDAWGLQRFNFGAPRHTGDQGEDGGEPEKRVQLNIVDTASQSSCFWGLCAHVDMGFRDQPGMLVLG